MGRRLALSLACGLGLTAMSTSAVATASGADVSAPPAQEATAPRPAGPNPYLSFLPTSEGVDVAAWQRWMEAEGDRRADRADDARRAAPNRPPVLVDESEPVGIRGGNDTVRTAQRVPGFGTSSGRNPRARLLGALSPSAVEAEPIAPNAEDDGALPLARDTGIAPTGGAVSTSGRIGDGPHGRAGSGTGDFDWYQVRAGAGRSVAVELEPKGNLFPVVFLYDDTGSILQIAVGGEEGIRWAVRTDATYHVVVAGIPSFQNDPSDPASGDGAGTEGRYDLTISVAEDDVDHYAVDLRRGDIVGASVAGEGNFISVFGPGGSEVHGSPQDASFVYPSGSPLPGGGNAVTDHVAERDGWHTVAVSNGDGRYDVTVEVYRPVLERERPVQTLFLDFDGARVNTNIWGGPGVRTLSPLNAFLGRWGLTNADRNRLIDRIVAVVRENLQADMAAAGLDDDFAIRILNSRDHADPFGRPNVSRVIVGGSIEQSGLFTIGVSQSIDPGNFVQEESAVVLLDVLSEPSGSEFADASLNTYLRPRSDRIRFIGQGVGNIVAHEAGHFFGDWHVDPYNAVANIMDAGGNPAVTFGVGPDGIGGTADDPDVDFGEDTFFPLEGFTGVEDTKTRVAFTLVRAI